jgi:hypothetical protein
MSMDIHLSNTDYGVKVDGFFYLLEGYREARYGTINITPINANGMGSYDGNVTLYLGEATIRAIAKLTADYVVEFDAEIANAEANELAEAN